MTNQLSITSIGQRVQAAAGAYATARGAIRYRIRKCRRHTGTEAQLLPHYDRLLRLGDQQLTEADRLIVEQVRHHGDDIALRYPQLPPDVQYPRRRDVVAVLNRTASALRHARYAIDDASEEPAGVRLPIIAAYGLIRITTHSLLRVDKPDPPHLAQSDCHAHVCGLVESLRPRVPAGFRTAFGGEIGGGEYTLALTKMIDTILDHGLPITIVERYALRYVLAAYTHCDYAPGIVDTMAIADASEFA